MNDVKTQNEQKRIILLNRLSIIIFTATIFFLLLDYIFEIHAQFFLFIVFAAASVGVYVLNSIGYSGAAKIFALVVFNIMIFVVASSEPFTTGLHLYLFAAGAVALTIYDFKEWPKSLFFASSSMGLMILLYLGDFSIIEKREFSDQKAKIFFVINGVINGSICIYSILVFSRLNYEAERSLLENEKVIRAQNDRLTKTNKELDRFVYSVSHDLRAPLSSISGLIQLAEKSDDLKETSQYLELMKGRIVRLEQFIRDIIDFSRNARSEIKVESVDLKELVNEIFQSLQFINGAESIALENNLPSSLIVQIDKTRLHIVLSNLISNAIQYRNRHNQSCFIRVGSNLMHDQLILKIEDNGIGIDSAHHSKIFNMFYRATESSKGSGLGLYIVKETVETLGGNIELHSALGKGTKFVLMLPVKAEENYELERI